MWAFSNIAVGRIVLLPQKLFYIMVPDEAQYGNSQRGKVFKCKATIEAAGLHVVGTKDVEHNHDGNLSTASAG